MLHGLWNPEMQVVQAFERSKELFVYGEIIENEEIPGKLLWNG